MADLERRLGKVPSVTGPFKNTGAEITAVEDAIRPVILERLGKAKRLPQYLLWHQSLAFVQAHRIGGLWFKDFSPTTEDVLLFGFDKRLQNRAQRDAIKIEEARTILERQPDDPENITIVIKKGQGFHVLARFPRGKNAIDAVDLDEFPQDPNRQDIVYFRPEQACTSMACSDMFQGHKINSNTAVLTVPYMTKWEAIIALSKYADEYGNVEYAPNGIPQMEHRLQMTAGIVGAYSNEIRRVRVSDFFSTHSRRRN